MDKAMKQRLVGASVLVALAVVVLPMLLGGAPDGQQDSRPIELPPKPRELAFDTRRFPVGEQDPQTPSVLPAPATAPQSDAPAETANGEAPQENTNGVEISAAPAPESSTEVVDAAASAVPLDEVNVDEAALNEAGEIEPAVEVAPIQVAPIETAGRYLVQVASFSSSANVERLSASLRGAGLPVLLDAVETAAGRLHRVRVGPYATAADAEAAMARIKEQNSDINPRMIDMRPDETAPVSQPSDPLVRWVVQVGSFSEAELAEALVYRLRDAGFAASSQRVSGDSGDLHKVRVGPVVDREEAVRLAAELRAGLELDGLVMSAD